LESQFFAHSSLPIDPTIPDPGVRSLGLHGLQEVARIAFTLAPEVLINAQEQTATETHDGSCEGDRHQHVRYNDDWDGNNGESADHNQQQTQCDDRKGKTHNSCRNGEQSQEVANHNPSRAKPE
jgi:hypothetical protein